MIPNNNTKKEWFNKMNRSILPKLSTVKTRSCIPTVHIQVKRFWILGVPQGLKLHIGSFKKGKEYQTLTLLQERLLLTSYEL